MFETIFHKKHLLFLLFFGYMINVSAQDKVTVELAKGTSLTGEIISYTYGDTLHLLIGGNHKISIPEDAIKKIKFQSPKEYYLFGDKKWINSTRFAIDAGATATSYSFNHTISKRVLPNLYIGIGAGIDNYYSSELYNVVPLFSSVKYYFKKSGFSPFIDLRGGYGLAFKNKNSNQTEANGGKHINPIIGYRFGKKQVYTEITMGLKFQKLDYHFSSATEEVDYDILIKRMEAGINFTF